MKTVNVIMTCKKCNSQTTDTFKLDERYDNMSDKDILSELNSDDINYPECSNCNDSTKFTVRFENTIYEPSPSDVEDFEKDMNSSSLLTQALMLSLSEAKHKTQTSEIILVKDMTDEHLENAANYFQNKITSNTSSLQRQFALETVIKMRLEQLRRLQMSDIIDKEI